MRHLSSIHLSAHGLFVLLTILFATICARSGVSDSTRQADTDSDLVPSVVNNPTPKMDIPANAAPILCLSPGHPSSEGDKYYEAILNRKVAWFLAIQLLESKYDVVLAVDDVPPQMLFFSGLSNDDQQLWSRLLVMTPDEKANRCNDAGADYIISIHHNYATSEEMNQTMVFFTMDDNYRPVHREALTWAETTAEYLGQVMETDDSYAIADLERIGFPLGILTNAKMPGILTEASFYSNPKERNRLNDDFYLRDEADAIFTAFTEHLRSHHSNDLVR